MSAAQEIPHEVLRHHIYGVSDDAIVSRVTYALPKRQSYISSDVLTCVDRNSVRNVQLS